MPPTVLPVRQQAKKYKPTFFETIGDVEQVEAFFPPEPFLPALRDFPATGEAGLWKAVLIDAVEIVLGLRWHARQRHAKRESWAWVMNDEWVSTGSFLWVCDYLRIDPGYVRRGLSATMRERSARGHNGYELIPGEVVAEKVDSAINRAIDGAI